MKLVVFIWKGMKMENEGENLLNNIITIDERWVRTYGPELKRQSAEWRHEGWPRKQNFRQNPSPVKLIVVLACDVRGVILCHFVLHGATVNAQYYAAYLQNHLRRTVRSKRPQLQNVIIFHDNSSPHKAICVRDLQRHCRWEVLEHPSYSPDLSPCDYDLIPKLKAPLRGHKFRTRDDIVIAVRRLVMTNFSHGEGDGIRRHIGGSAQLTVLGITLKACKINVNVFVECFLH